MSDGSVKIDVGLNLGQAEKDLAKLKAKIEKAEDALNADSSKKNAIEQQLGKAGAAADVAKRKVIELKQEIASTRSRDEKASLRAQLADATEEQRILTRESDRLNDEYVKVSSSIEKGEQNIAEMREQAGQLAQEIARERPGEILANGLENAKKKLMTFLKYAIGIRSVFFLFRRLRSAIKDAVSSFAEYDDETKNTINELKASLQQLKMSWGAAFAPILNSVAPLLQKFIGWLTDAANAITRFFAVMSGKNTYKKVTVSMEDMAGAADDTAESAKEAKKQLMGFDELNILNRADESGKTSSEKGSSAKVEDVDVGEVSPLLENLRKAVNDIKALFNGDVSLKEFLSNLNAVEVAILALGSAAIIGALVSFTSKLLGLSGAGAKFGASAAKIGTAALAVADAFLIAYDVSKLNEAARTYHEAQETHNKETETALETYKKLYEEKGKEVADEWAATVYQIDTTNMEFDEAQKAIAEKIETYWEDVPQDMWTGFKQGWNEYFGENGKGLWQLFKDAFSSVIKWTKNLLGIHSPSTVFESIGEQIVQGLWNGVSNKWNSFVLFFQNAWTRLRSWWDGLSLKAFHIPVPHFEWTYSQASGVIAQALSFVGLPDTIPHLNISWYARGGVFNTPQMIGVGENGKEAVVPLERNTEWMQTVADGLMDRLTQANFASQLASAFASTPMPAMAGGGIVPPNAIRSGGGYGADSMASITEELRALKAAIMSQPVAVSTKVYLDRRQVGQAVTEYQRDSEMARG